MPNLWNDPSGAKYVKVKSDKLLELLDDRIIFEDNPWTNIKTIQTELDIPEFDAIGIIMYLWMNDKIRVRPDDNGELTVTVIE
jgi:hypothetical protein